MEKVRIIPKQNLDDDALAGVQSLRTDFDAMEGRLFTTIGHEKKVWSEIFSFMKSFDRRLSRIEKLMKG